MRELHDLQECIIRGIAWQEPAFVLTVVLEYVWTDDGQICFTVGHSSREVVVTFHLVNRLTMFSALNTQMLAQPDRLDWGVSEIAKLEFEQAVGPTEDFAVARFLWEGGRIIEVEYQALGVEGPRAKAWG